MARFSRRRKFCRSIAEDVKKVDYKNLNTLKAYVSGTDKIVLSHITGTKVKYQHRLATVTERARCLTPLPYTGSHGR